MGDIGIVVGTAYFCMAIVALYISSFAPSRSEWSFAAVAVAALLWPLDWSRATARFLIRGLREFMAA